MQILEELYLGSVRPSERSGKRNAQYRKERDNAINADDAFRPTLTEVQKKLFENLLDAQQDLPLLREIDTSTRCTQAEPKNSLGSLSLGSSCDSMKNQGFPGFFQHKTSVSAFWRRSNHHNQFNKRKVV